VHEEIVIAGMGGQGVLFIGRLLAEAGLLEGREVVWVPTYGGEKRGGSVRCDVTISDRRIGALCVSRPTAAVAMNQLSLALLEPTVKPAGLLVVNRSMAASAVRREDIGVTYVPADDLATAAGDDSASNLVALGVLIAVCPVVSVAGILEVMDNTSLGEPGRVELNRQALTQGHSWAQTEH